MVVVQIEIVEEHTDVFLEIPSVEFVDVTIIEIGRAVLHVEEP